MAHITPICKVHMPTVCSSPWVQRPFILVQWDCKNKAGKGCSKKYRAKERLNLQCNECPEIEVATLQ